MVREPVHQPSSSIEAGGILHPATVSRPDRPVPPDEAPGWFGSSILPKICEKTVRRGENRPGVHRWPTQRVWVTEQRKIAVSQAQTMCSRGGSVNTLEMTPIYGCTLPDPE